MTCQSLVKIYTYRVGGMIPAGIDYKGQSYFTSSSTTHGEHGASTDNLPSKKVDYNVKFVKTDKQFVLCAEFCVPHGWTEKGKRRRQHNPYMFCICSSCPTQWIHFLSCLLTTYGWQTYASYIVHLTHNL